MDAPDVLAFADRRTDGVFAVTDPSGATVASISVGRWSGTSFEATGADGEPLCSGRRAGIFSSAWRCSDPLGQPVVELRKSWWGSGAEVALPTGRTLALRGSLFGRDWSLTDDRDQPVLGSTPTNSAWSFRPDAWLVRLHDASLDLAQVVGIVELHRLAVKAGRSSAASASGA